MTGAVMVGTVKLIKNGGAVKSKIHFLKMNVAQIAKNAFQRKQASQIKMDTTSLEGIARAVADSQPIIIAREQYRGGSYDAIKMQTHPHNIERHHMPAQSVSQFSKGEGPAIHMEIEDHMQTSSWGRSNASQAYKQIVKQKIESGDLRGAMATEIWDVKRVTGTKYNDAMREMLDYGKSSGKIPHKK
jgi:hypothetical protein